MLLVSVKLESIWLDIYLFVEEIEDTARLSLNQSIPNEIKVVIKSAV